MVKVETNRFTDFDRLFSKKNMLITFLGSALAFIFSYFEGSNDPLPSTLINFEWLGLPAIPPYKLSLTIAVVLIVSAYTRNISSSVFVGIIGAIGLVSPHGDGTVDWILGYILMLLLISFIIGVLADRLRLVMDWVDFYLMTAFLFAVYIIAWGIYTNPHGAKYFGSYDLGTGGDFDTGIGFPIVDLTALLVILLLTLIFMFITNGQIVLASNNVKKYKLFGYFFLIIGQAISLVSIIAFSDKISEEDMLSISSHDSQLKTVGDLFSHYSTGNYAIIVYPSNIFIMAAFTTVFTAIGLSLLIIGRNGGNIDGMKGGSDVVFLAAPIGTILFLTLGSYIIQNVIDPHGFYIGEELVTMMAAMIWSVLTLNQLIARIVLFFMDRISPQK